MLTAFGVPWSSNRRGIEEIRPQILPTNGGIKPTIMGIITRDI
jgi:hypothetical protein